jgi:hypothetical protein
MAGLALLGSHLESLIHCFKAPPGIGINIFGLRWNEQTIEYFLVNKPDIVASHWFNGETVLAPE